MPAFTAVATAIVSYAFYGAVGVTFAAGTIGAFVVSVVATGLAYATTSLLNKSSSGSGGTSQDPGVRIQLPPATNNKIPVVYGTAYTKGVITDARISNENKTMTYVLTLSEKTQTGSFSVGEIYWNDSLLQFKAAPDGHVVSGSIDQGGKGTTSTNFADLIRIRVYAGSTDSSNQIFPTSGTAVNARTLLDESDTNYQLNGLVFAVVQVDYSQEKNVVALANMTFQITNSLSNPGQVWYDYMTSTRYGAGIPISQVDTASSTSGAADSLYTISNQIPDNQFQSDGTTPSTQPRYQINGVLSTGVNVKSNIQRINDASSSWTAYDISDGKWRVIPNRVANAGEISAAQAFNDDNIIGDVGVTATNLEDLFNILEVEYPSRTIRDQDDYYRNAIASNDRNQLEPNNVLNLRLDLVNNAIHAGRIGLIQLKQSRVDLIITFRADYTALQAEAGDLISVTNDVYGFVNKIFRVTKLREVEDEAGTLTVEVTALEYNSTVYTDETLVDGASPQASGIPQFGSSTTLPAPSAPVISNINPTSNVPNFTISTTIPGTSGPVSIVEWFYSSSASGTYLYLANERSASGNFAAGATVSDEIFNLDAGTWYFKARTGSGGLSSDFSAASSALVWTPTPGGANNGTISTATNALDILVTGVTSGDYYLSMTSGLNDFEEIKGDSNLTWNAATNKMYFGPHEVSTVTNAVVGEYLATGTQSIATSTNVAAVTFDQTVHNTGISLSNSSRINVPIAGTYFIQFSTQFINTANTAYRASMWLRKNGNDVVDSNTVVTVPARHGNTDGSAVMSVSFLEILSTNDYVELYWNAENSTVALTTIPESTSAPIFPRAPAVIFSIHRVVGGLA